MLRLTVLKERVAGLRPVYLPPDRASRTTYLPAGVAHFDGQLPVRIR